jgi:hypothetical protein
LSSINLPINGAYNSVPLSPPLHPLDPLHL